MNHIFVKELGRGGFGVVNEIEAPDGSRFACKVLNVPAHMDVDMVRRRFEREVRYQSAINHPNVVRIEAHHLDSDPPWFIMPLAECSLLDEWKLDRTLGGDPSTPLFHILAGLEEIHRLGYCHRDLKPGNVLKFSIADGETVYALSDFGLMAVGEDASSTLTPSGMGGGTPAYQAPECAINFRRATPRSDIYSFGAMLHDIFGSTVRRLPHEELTVSGTLGPIVEKCTKRNAHRRYKNVEELREALFAALDNYQFEFGSDDEKEIVDILTRETPALSSEEWDLVFDFLDETPDNGSPTKNVFRALRREHIDQLHSDDPDLMEALGRLFADHCRNRSFDFDYTDVVAAKAQLFYDHGELALKAGIAIALLVMGTDHNRWYVERKFHRMVGPDANEAMINRMIVEMNVLNVNAKSKLDHVCRSISVSPESFHPLLLAIMTQ